MPTLQNANLADSPRDVAPPAWMPAAGNSSRRSGPDPAGNTHRCIGISHGAADDTEKKWPQMSTDDKGWRVKGRWECVRVESAGGRAPTSGADDAE